MSKVKNIVLFCALGFRSALATKALRDMGFKNVANAKVVLILKNAGIEVVQKEKNNYLRLSVKHIQIDLDPKNFIIN